MTAVVDLGREMVGDADEDVSEPSTRVDVIEVGDGDEGVHSGSSLAAAVTAREQPGLLAMSNAAESAFCCFVVHANSAVTKEPGERGPAIESSALARSLWRDSLFLVSSIQAWKSATRGATTV